MSTEDAGQAPANNPTPTPTAPKTNTGSGTTTVTLNKTLMLKKGSTGNEVKELQRLLGFTGSGLDGIFGTNTENKLFALKLVKQCTLREFESLTTVNQNPLAIGNRIMANKKPEVKIYRAQPLANGSYDLNSEALDSVDFGDEIGTIKMISTYKTRYLIAKPGQTTIYGWVEASQVKKI